ncbi:DoxX family protein [Citricoccus parietis]
MYALLGYEAAKAPGPRVGMAAPLLDSLRKVAPLPVDNETVVRANGAVQMAAGSMLALGAAPRLSAAALVGSMVPTTFAGHPFWKVQDPAARSQQRTQFLKNMSLIGGLLFTALDAGQHRQEKKSRKVAQQAA